MNAPSTSGRPVPPPARDHSMVTRSMAQANETYQAQLAERRAQYANCPGTGYMPPEYGYAPVKPGPRSRIFA